MTADELTEGCFRAKQSFNRHTSIFSRLLDRRTNLSSLDNLWMFLLVNYINRREMYLKQGQRLGD